MRRSLKIHLLAAPAALALVLGVGLADAQARTPEFTLEQVMSAPFASDMVAAPTGGRVAWVYDANGTRNIWVAEPSGSGAFAARPLTAYTGDDGSDLGDLTWDPAGKSVYYVRGGSLGGGGPVNILSRPEGPPPQEIWSVSLDGAAPRRIGPGGSPTVSPRGDRVAWLAGGQVFVEALGQEPKPAQLIHDRGRDTAIAWSPDGGRLAFTSNRRDHTLLGVYDVASKTVRWMHPSVDTDADPAWSPDGKRIAFIRAPASSELHFYSRRADVPWSIWVADPATGDARAVWTADAGPGSVPRPLEATGNLRWAAGDRLVFPWEKTGWSQLWSVSAAGGAAAPISPPGAYEVFEFSLTPDGRDAVWSSNQGDSDHRHLWIAPVSGGPANAVTSGATIEDYPVVGSDGRVFGLYGSSRDPMRPVAFDAGKPIDLAKGVIPADFPASKLVEPRQVVFQGPDGLPVHGQLFLRKGESAGRKPAIVFFHGGPRRQMLLGWHPMDSYAHYYALNQYLASEGYVVLSVNFRGGTGYGLNFREAENFGPGGASEDNDIVGAATFLRARPDVDPARIAVHGGSYGGLMTALSLSRHSDLFAAGVDYAGVHDWKVLMPALVAPGAPADAAQLAWESSAIGTVGRWRSPVLIVHSDDDRNVPFAESVELVEALRKHHVEVEQIVIPDEIHDLLRNASWLALFHATDEYLKRKLKP
jgi:dipeptidyl aminopeptidase/acylaminoacyl peptidase